MAKNAEKSEKMSFLDSKTYKGDCKFYFQCNEKFGSWCYYQKTPKLKAKNVISLIGVNPLGSLRCKMKRKTIKNLNLINFCSTFQSKLYSIKKAISKSLF